MKICPSCQTRYSDDTLRFCLQDGTPLVPDQPIVTSSAQMSQPTVVLPAPYGRRRSVAVPVLLTALGMLVLFVIGVIGWSYLRKTQTSITVNTSNSAATQSPPVSNVVAAATPREPPRTNANAAINANATLHTPTVDADQATRDVRRAIDGWRSSGEELDVDTYMHHYAPTVDYYLKPGATRDFVRDSKMKAFSTYDSIKVDLSNMSITTDPTGDTATAVFDKEWNFDGIRNSSGKVRQMLKLRKIDGQWLITAEKDLHLYYKR